PLAMLGDAAGSRAAADAARDCFERAGDRRRLARLDVNLASVWFREARFDDAEAVFRSARAYALAHGMPALVAQAEYNIGYLYFLRGQHVKAIRALDQAHTTAARQGDKMHLALCDLDQADVCIEIHLYQDALAL